MNHRHKRITKEDIIMDALIECLQYEHITTRKEMKESGKTVFNPHFWEQGEFISLDYINKYGDIVFTQTQPGTKPSDSYHKISIAFPYGEYKPFHDRWNRENKINQLINEK